MIAVVIQGGAMRSIYCLGAVRAIIESGLSSHVSTIHTSSAGCVSATVLATHITDDRAPQVETTSSKLLDALANSRFINPLRLCRIVDVDYLINVMRKVMPISREVIADHNVVFEVGMTDAETGTAHYIDIARAKSDQEMIDALRATMAIPVLYPKHVHVNGRRYVDGGITDPLPFMRALVRNPTAIIAITSVPKNSLARTLEGYEGKVMKYIPGISSPVRNLMLSMNPLADSVDKLLDSGDLNGIHIARISPSDAKLVGSRLELDRERLSDLESLGYKDGMESLRQLVRTLQID